MEIPELDAETRVATLHLDLVELGYLRASFSRHHDSQFPASELIRMKLDYLVTLVYAQSDGYPLQERARGDAERQKVALEIVLGE